MARRDYTPEDVDTGLTALTLLGSSKTAATHLREQGLNVSDSTLRGWKSRYADRLAQIQEREAPEVARRVASRSEAVAMKAIEIEERLLAKLDQSIDELKPADAAAALRNVTTSKSLNFDRLSGPIRGRPNVIVEKIDAGQALLEMARRLGIAVDSTAIED